jgi:hypothetical protein
MRELAYRRSTFWHRVEEIMHTATDGGPRGQRRMAARILEAGAVDIDLKPGKRGKYEIDIYDQVGWDVARDAEIKLGDRIPEKPWLVCNYSRIKSLGGGRNQVDAYSKPIIFITHHVISRMAQRLELRDADDLGEAMRMIWNATVTLMHDKGVKQWLDAPACGWRVPLAPEKSKAVVILQRHDKRKALVAATVLEPGVFP